jgi:hypothetical protein
MTTQPTNLTTAKAAEPKVKDRFLDKLVEMLGYEQGVKFYQQGDVTEQEITDFIALAKKFNVYTKITGRR